LLVAIGCCAASAVADEPSPKKEQIEVSPQEIALHGPRQSVQVLITGRATAATQADEMCRDLTRTAAIELTDPSVAQVTVGGRIRPLREGTTQLTIRHAGETVCIPVRVDGMQNSEPASFRNEVVPTLTKTGCNSGKCHGSPSGRAGFALSLRGYDPDADYLRITREAGGRRANPCAPAESLLLLKATAAISHGGGRRFGKDEASYALMADWIARGAPTDINESKPVALELLPRERWLEADQTGQQMRAVARFADGSSRDVTELAQFSVSDDQAAQVSPAGLVERGGGGEVSIAAGYGPLFATSKVVFLPDRQGFAWPNPHEANEIDRFVFAKLRRLRIAPSPVADDATYLRRAWLDVCGLLPRADDVRAFLADTRGDKRERLIDTLLERPEYADFWAMKWADRLGCNQRFVGKAGAQKYYRWIRHQIATNVPEDALAASILTAAGGNYSQPPAGFYRLPRTPEDRAEHFSQVFLGVRIGCARCHNHPGESWTQDDYYGLAAFFARLKYRNGPFFNHMYDKEETIIPTRAGELIHPRTGQAVVPRALGGAGTVAQDDADRRLRLVRWLIAPENPFFAKAAANRIWHQLLGRGIVDPVDDFRSSNPPANAELLDALASDYAAHGYDRKHLIRKIMQSRTYQLASAVNDTNAGDERYFSHARVRLLSAEQMLDCIGQATGSPEKFSGFPAGLRAAELADGEHKHVFLTAFGRPARSLACACERDGDSNLVQALELVGGDTIEDKIRARQGSLARLLSSGVADTALLEDCFLSTLSRYPTVAERKQLGATLATAKDRRAATEDLLWALINHREFLFQH